MAGGKKKAAAKAKRAHEEKMNDADTIVKEKHGEEMASSLVEATATPLDADGNPSVETEEVKIQYVYTYIAVDDEVLYDVTVAACASSNTSCRTLPIVRGAGSASSSESETKAAPSLSALLSAIPTSERGVSVVVLCRPMVTMQEIKELYASKPQAQPSLHILVDSEEDAKQYHELWGSITETFPPSLKKILPCKVHAFAPTDHHKGFPVNESSPRYLEVFRHVWLTYFGRRFPKDVTRKRIAEAEGFRQCLFKPCTTADNWREAIQAIVTCSTNILERTAVRSGVEVVKYVDNQARSIVYHPCSKPLFIATKGFRNASAAALYNSDIDPFFIACAFNERCAADEDFAASFGPDKMFDVKYIGTYRMLDDNMVMEVKVCPCDVGKGGRSWLFAHDAAEITHLRQAFVDPCLRREGQYTEIPFLVPDAVAMYSSCHHPMSVIDTAPSAPSLTTEHACSSKKNGNHTDTPTTAATAPPSERPSTPTLTLAQVATLPA